MAAVEHPDSPQHPLLSVQGLAKNYGETQALCDVSFELGEGEVVGLLGANGAGKSTCLRILTGCLAPSGGQIFVRGQDMARLGRRARAQVGYLPEIPPLYPDLRVEGQLAFAAQIKGLAKSQQRAEIDRVCALVDIDDRRRQLVSALSKGYRQRLGLAQALIGSPPLVFLDEPTSGLDPRQLDGFRKLIRELARRQTVLLSTHLMQEVTASCSRVIILDRGAVRVDARLDALREQHPGQSLEQIFLSLTSTTEAA